MRAAMDTVVAPCVCVCVHIGITKERYQQIHRNTGIIFNFAYFPKNALFKSYGVICLPRAALASLRCFFREISFYASFEAYSYVFTAQTTYVWKTVYDLLAQTCERHRYTDHEY